MRICVILLVAFCGCETGSTYRPYYVPLGQYYMPPAPRVYEPLPPPPPQSMGGLGLEGTLRMLGHPPAPVVPAPATDEYRDNRIRIYDVNGHYVGFARP